MLFLLLSNVFFAGFHLLYNGLWFLENNTREVPFFQDLVNYARSLLLWTCTGK